jgi:hypothetical protein
MITNALIPFGSVTAAYTPVGIDAVREYLSIDSTLNQPVIIELDYSSNPDANTSEIYVRANATPITIPSSAYALRIKAVSALPTSGDIVINAWS